MSNGFDTTVALPPAPGERPAGVRVTRGAFAILSTQPITWATSLVLAVLVPRLLGDAALGVYGVSYGIASLLANVASLGLPNLLTRKVATEPERAASYAWSGALIVTLFSVIIAVPLLSVVAAIKIEAIDIVVTAIAIACALLAVLQGVFMSALVGLGRNARSAWSGAGTQVLTTAIGVATLLLGGGVHAYAFALLIGSIVGTGIVLWASRLHFTRSAFDAGLLRGLVMGGLPFLGWNVALRVRGGLDVILTGVLLHASVAGWLVAAYRIIGITVFIPTVITVPLLPALSRCKGRLDEYRSLLAESLGTVILLTVPVSASIVALAPAIPGLLGWPGELEHAVPVMMILAFQQPLVAVDMVLGTSLIALGLERPWLKVAVLGAIVNPSLNLVAIPLFQALTGNGAIGAAWVELATEVLFLGGAVYMTPRGLLGRNDLSRAARTVAAGLVLIAVASLLRPSGPAVAFAGGGIAYLAVASALGVLGPRQIRAVRLALRTA